MLETFELLAGYLVPDPQFLESRIGSSVTVALGEALSQQRGRILVTRLLPGDLREEIVDRAGKSRLFRCVRIDLPPVETKTAVTIDLSNVLRNCIEGWRRSDRSGVRRHGGTLSLVAACSIG
ncbi:MAG: hypothetical protein AAGE90_07070 [Pseudomonadota bacterium]